MKLKNTPARKLQRQIEAAWRATHKTERLPFEAYPLTTDQTQQIEQARTVRTKKHRAPRASF